MKKLFNLTVLFIIAMALVGVFGKSMTAIETAVSNPEMELVDFEDVPDPEFFSAKKIDIIGKEEPNAKTRIHH